MRAGAILRGVVLICSAPVVADPHECTVSNANTVLRVPMEFGNPATCIMHAQAYLAGSSIGRELDASERGRIICEPRESVIASTPGQ